MKHKEKQCWNDFFPDLLERFFLAAGAVCVGIALFALLCCREYPERLAGNKILMLFVLLFFVSGAAVYRISGKGKKQGSNSALNRTLNRTLNWRIMLVLGYAALFAAQVLWVNKVYFYTGWDVVTIRSHIEWVINGGTMQDRSIDLLFSIYPNNLLFFYLSCLIEKIGILFSMAEPYDLCIYISCLCVNLSCLLGNLIMRRLSESNVVRFLYTVISTVFILFSPWIMIPYSDTFGMPFVMLGIWGVVCLKQRYAKWGVVSFAGFVGYLIKPTCIFPLFAAGIVFGVRYLLCLRKYWRELFALILCGVVSWCIGLLIPLWIQHTYSFRIYPDSRMTHTHFLMMGINEETGGGFSTEDFMYSLGFPDVKTREQADRELFVRRLGELAEGRRLGTFLKRKTLVNFNDGTFAWNGEGGFFFEKVEHEGILWKWFLDTMVPPGTWENEGVYYYLFRTIMQMIWLQILVGVMFVGFDRRNFPAQKACLMIALCGLMAFVMIFEARARYLFLYSPVFLILSLCGYEGIWGRAAAWISDFKYIKMILPVEGRDCFDYNKKDYTETGMK